MRKIKENRGITLIALVVTIIVLLILAGVSIAMLTGENGLINQANTAKENTKYKSAREKLEIALNGAIVEKHTNKLYNQNSFLDEWIHKEIKCKICSTGNENESVVIVDGYAFLVDRTVPKIDRDMGTEEEMAIPTIEGDYTLKNGNTEATIDITAIESKKGITKIEIIQEGFVINDPVYSYSNEKGEITEHYPVYQNGIYIVKVYGEVSVSVIVDVKGVIATARYEPNENTEYRESHDIKVTVSTDKPVTIQYQWTDSTVAPAIDTFGSNTCTNGESFSTGGLTGTYYLWTLVTLDGTPCPVTRSGAFNFDNSNPTITGVNGTPVSESSFTLDITASDTGSGIAKYEIYVDEVLNKTLEGDEFSNSYTVTDVDTGSHECSIIAYDEIGHYSQAYNCSASTKVYAWKKYNANTTVSSYEKKSMPKTMYVSWTPYTYNNSLEFNTSTGMINAGGIGKKKPAEFVSGKYCLCPNGHSGSQHGQCGELLLVESYESNSWPTTVSGTLYYMEPVKSFTSIGSFIRNVYSNSSTEHSDGWDGDSYYYVSLGLQDPE